MTLTPEDLARLSRLSRLRLSAEEERALAADLDAILGRFEEIARAPEGSQEEAPSPPFREDEPAVAPREEIDGIVAAFPVKAGRAASVPRSLP